MTKKETKENFERGTKKVGIRAALRREKRGPNMFERKNPSVFAQMFGALFGFGSHK